MAQCAGCSQAALSDCARLRTCGASAHAMNCQQPGFLSLKESFCDSFLLSPAGCPHSITFPEPAPYPRQRAPVRSFTRYAWLHPPRCRGLLFQNDLTQKVRCARQSLSWGEQTILVLDHNATVEPHNTKGEKNSL